MKDSLVFYHAPQTRSSVALTLLEELEAPFELQLLNMKADEQRQSPYLAINPLGKVPALLHGDTLVTEQVAIFIYLADLFPEKALAPAITSPQRGDYLRWMVYYAACYEPALVDKAQGREVTNPKMSVYGDFDTMLGTVLARLAKGPYLLGEQFSAADILWGSALNWGLMFKLLPESPLLTDYVNRIVGRPSAVKVAARDQQWAQAHQAALDQQPA